MNAQEIKTPAIIILSLFLTVSFLQSCKKKSSNSITDPIEEPSPEITSINPSSGMVGDTVTIRGIDFSSISNENQVFFNGIVATIITSISTQIEAVVPEGATTGTLSVVAEGVEATGPVFTVEEPARVIQTTAGDGFSCALTNKNEIYCWGNNTQGQLGDGSTTNRTDPGLIRHPAGVIFTNIAAGALQAYAISDDGIVWAWGNNQNGALGDGSQTSDTIPIMTNMPAGVRFDTLDASNHAVTLDSDGNAWTWGFGPSGQLGNGASQSSLSPVMVTMPAGVSFTKIAAGRKHSLALDADGKVWAWGDNADGQLGNNSTINSNIPIEVSIQPGVIITNISAGQNFSIALDSDGNAWGWGDNSLGSIGDGTTEKRFIPRIVDMPTGTSFSFLSSGRFAVNVIASNGQAWGWGPNALGQLGTGSSSGLQTSPVETQMPTDINFMFLKSGDSHSLAIDANGEIWVWGSNTFGQLGDGSTDSSGEPKLIDLGN